MTKPAARVADMHTCGSHVGGPVMPPGEATVQIGGMPAARVTDKCVCIGPADLIVTGAPGVLTGGMPAARMGDSTHHGGSITAGCPTVLIGDAGSGAALAAMQAIADSINPAGSTVNCAHIVDAVVARLSGNDPDATAPNLGARARNLTEARHGTRIDQGTTFQNVFDAVQAGGPGTAAIIGINYSSGGGHVVTIANVNGQVGIIEGQDWGAGNPREVITDPARANTRYNSDGGSRIRYGTVQ